MRFTMDDAISTSRDVAGATRDSFNYPKLRYLERKRVRCESCQFRDAWAKASFIGGFLGRPGAELLFELAAAVPASQDIVEVGSYLGRSAAFLALGAGPGRMVHAVDHHAHCLNTSKLFQVHMEELDVAERVEAVRMVSAEAASCYKGRPIGLLFVDAEHTEDAVFEDGRMWSAHLAPGGFVAFDDIGMPEVARGVKRLVSDGVLPEITGRVGKIGLCGPSLGWPERVRAIAINA